MTAVAIVAAVVAVGAAIVSTCAMLIVKNIGDKIVEENSKRLRRTQPTRIRRTTKEGL